MIRSSKYASITSTIGAQAVMDATRGPIGDDGSDSEPPLIFPPAFSPESLFANGEKGCLYIAGRDGALFTDVARTLPAINENDVIAAVRDWSPNACHAQKVTTSQRPKLILSANNYRRRVDYDGVNDSLTVPVPAMGSSCTVFRARPGIGGVITGGVTIKGTQTDSTDFTVLGIINRALTTAETADLQLYLDQRSGVTDEYNVAYGADTTNEILDVFHSSGLPSRPIIFMCHGGAWRTGSKQSPNVIKNKLQYFLPQGFTLVSINYKLDVGTDPLDQCRSVAKALAWVQKRAYSWGCNPKNIVVMGHSAGAHLTTLMTSKQSYLDEFGVRPWLGNVVIDSAAYNLNIIMLNPSHLTLYDEPWGTDPQHWHDGSPTLVLDRQPPPLFLITSTDTNPGESDGLAGPYRDAVVARAGTATIYPTAYLHDETNINLGLPNQYTTDVMAFIAPLLPSS